MGACQGNTGQQALIWMGQRQLPHFSSNLAREH